MLTLAMLSLVVLALIVSDAANGPTPGSLLPAPITATLPERSEERCVQVRRQFLNETDSDSDIQAHRDLYDGMGCRQLCGAMVEDTDTVERETRCAYP